MIVEDEFGNDIDLSDERDDDYEAQPPDPEPLLSLERIEAAHAKAMSENYADISDAAKLVMFEAVPQMLDELRYWRSLKKDSQHAVTFGDSKDSGYILVGDADAAAELAAEQNGTAWVRDVYRDEWERPEQLSDEPPF